MNVLAARHHATAAQPFPAPPLSPETAFVRLMMANIVTSVPGAHQKFTRIGYPHKP